MTNYTVKLREIYKNLQDTGKDVTLEVFAHTYSAHFAPAKRFPAMIVCPGGGYTKISERESEPIALALLGRGIQCFVLRYSTFPARFPAQHLELAAAVAYVRTHADEFMVDPDAIGVMGFSAGGHLAGSYAASLWHDEGFARALGVEVETLRPNAMALCYGVLCRGREKGDIYLERLLGPDAPGKLWDRISLDRSAGEHTPPAFIWHTFADTTVPVRHALCAAEALAEKKIPFELHVYPDGAHGLALADYTTDAKADKPAYRPPGYTARWLSDCADWFYRTCGYVGDRRI